MRFSAVSFKVSDYIQTYLGWKNMSFEIKESMEVISNEDGMDGPYFPGKVIDRSPGRRTIKYDTLITDDGSPLEEVISIRRLCPSPPLCSRDLLSEIWLMLGTMKAGGGMEFKIREWPDQELAIDAGRNSRVCGISQIDIGGMTKISRCENSGIGEKDSASLCQALDEWPKYHRVPST
ncbi:hypothetical protein LXL04_035012 [Taraxacum kok-saghyz]